MWAKTNGNYEQIDGGDALESVEWLTNCMGFSYSFEHLTDAVKDGLTTWNLIADSLKKKYPVTLSSYNGIGHSQYGIVNNHAYAVTGVAELKNINGTVVYRLV